MEHQSDGEDAYLFEAGQFRETEAVELVLFHELLTSLAVEYLGPTLGWCGKWNWYAVRIPSELVFPGVDTRGLPGDIDVMGGPLALPQLELASERERWREQMPTADPTWWDVLASMTLLRAGKLLWPPTLHEIGAAEAKSSYFGASGTPKATKLRRLKKAFRQTAGLARMGFDRAALLWILATEPVRIEGVSDFWQWIEAGARGEILADHLGAALRQDALDPFGQILLRLGAVLGGSEAHRGSMSGRVLRLPPILARPPGSERSMMRVALEDFLRGVFERYPTPYNVPVVIRACAPGGCGEVFIPFIPTDRRCPKCGRDTGGSSK